MDLHLISKSYTEGGDLQFGSAQSDQSIVPDTAKATGQNMQDEAAQELVRGERHRLVAHAALGSIILTEESETALIQDDESAIGD